MRFSLKIMSSCRILSCATAILEPIEARTYPDLFKDIRFPEKERESAGISREKTGTTRDTPEKFFRSAIFRRSCKLQ